MRCLDEEKFEFWVSGEGFGLHFGRLLVTLGSLCQVFLGYQKEVGILTDAVGTRPGFREPLGTNFGVILTTFS